MVNLTPKKYIMVLMGILKSKTIIIMLKRSTFLIFIISLSSCYCAQNTSKAHLLKIDFAQNNSSTIDDIKILGGNIQQDSLYSTVRFDPVEGGSTGILFIYTHKEYHGDKIKDRLTLSCDSRRYPFSVNEILKWETKKIGTEHVYIAPKMCSD